MKKKVLNLLKTILLILLLCIPVLQFGNGVGVQAATKLATPKLVSAKAQGTSKIKVTWKKVSGADGYKVYRKTYGTTKWKAIKTISSNISTFTDTKLESGMYYSYTVRTMKNKAVLSGYNKKGVYAVTNLEIPTNLKAHITEDGAIEISWKEVPKSNGYYIYRKTADSPWKMIYNCDRDDWYEDYSAKGDIQYYYTVRPYVRYDKIYKGSYDKNGIKAPIINPVMNGLKFKVNERMLCKQGTFSLEFEDYNGDMNNVTWTSSNSNVATVNNQGKVKAIDYGESTITATAYGKSCECKIKVVTLIQVDKTEYKLSKATTVDLKWANGYDDNATISYNIDDTDVVSCNWEKGEAIDYYWISKLTITPKSNGSTNIKLTNTCNNEIIVLHVAVTGVKTLSASEVDLTISEKTTINIHSTTGRAMYYEIETLGIVTCEWGEWDGNNNCPLYITPQSNGVTNIIITDKKTQDTLNIHVNVKGYIIGGISEDKYTDEERRAGYAVRFAFGRLKNPSSFQITNAGYFINRNNHKMILIDYKAQNSYGGWVYHCLTIDYDTSLDTKSYAFQIKTHNYPYYISLYRNDQPRYNEATVSLNIDNIIQYANTYAKVSFDYWQPYYTMMWKEKNSALNEFYQ